MKRLFVFILILAILLPSTAVWADSNISTAVYRATIKVSNNGTDAENVATVFTANTTAWQNVGYLNAQATDSAMLSAAEADLPYMPGYAGNPWVVWVPSISKSSHINDYLYLGGQTNMGGKIRYFPGSAGMTVGNSTSLQLSSNFTMVVYGWLDADNGTDKNIIRTDGTFKLYISPTESGNITAQIYSSPATIISVSVVTSGESKIRVTANGIDLLLIVNEGEEDEVSQSVPLESTEIPEAVNDWHFFENYSMLYVYKVKIFAD